jgi:uncharacterized protein
MKIVLDTNVLVSGLLNPHGPPGAIVRLVAAGDLRVCYDARILAEYREVLLRPAFPFRPDQVDAFLDQLRACGEPVAASPLPAALLDRLPDRDDAMFLEVALAAGVECLVTGNVRHYPARARGDVAVVTPAGLVERLRGRY